MTTEPNTPPATGTDFLRKKARIKAEPAAENPDPLRELLAYGRASAQDVAGAYNLAAAAYTDMSDQLSEIVESPLDRRAVDAALRQVIATLDYDLHKGLESDEMTGDDQYGEHVDRFIAAYADALGQAVQPDIFGAPA
jgi:hypothetical protein